MYRFCQCFGRFWRFSRTRCTCRLLYKSHNYLGGSSPETINCKDLLSDALRISSAVCRSRSIPTRLSDPLEASRWHLKSDSASHQSSPASDVHRIREHVISQLATAYIAIINPPRHIFEYDFLGQSRCRFDVDLGFVAGKFWWIFKIRKTKVQNEESRLHRFL